MEQLGLGLSLSTKIFGHMDPSVIARGLSRHMTFECPLLDVQNSSFRP